MSTISMFLNILQTRAKSRTELGDFRIAYGEVSLLNQQSVELVKSKSFTANADRFLVINCLESLPVTLQFYDADGDPSQEVDTFIQGIFSFPGKVSISIENPADNTSDLPYRFTAFYS